MGEFLLLFAINTLLRKKSPWMNVFLILSELHPTKGVFRAAHGSSPILPLPEVFTGQRVPIFGFTSALSISFAALRDYQNHTFNSPSRCSKATISDTNSHKDFVSQNQIWCHKIRLDATSPGSRHPEYSPNLGCKALALPGAVLNILNYITEIKRGIVPFNMDMTTSD